MTSMNFDEIDCLMQRYAATDSKGNVRVICHDGRRMVGVASDYQRTDGGGSFASLRITNADEDTEFFKADEIKTIEPIDDKKAAEMGKIMEQVAEKNAKVRIVDDEGKTMVGIANSFHTGYDEEDGYPSFCIDTDDGGCWGFRAYELNSIEEIE